MIHSSRFEALHLTLGLPLNNMGWVEHRVSYFDVFKERSVTHILWYNGNFGAQIFQANLRDIDAMAYLK